MYIQGEYIMSDKELKLTTVKVLSKLYNEFKHKTLESNFTLQKLVNRSMYLYLNEQSMTDKIEQCIVASGSRYHI